MACPNFFLAGAPKCGTTSLYYYLSQHPEIYMSPIKEPHFLADELRLANYTQSMRVMAERRLRGLRQYLDGPMLGHFSAGPIESREDYFQLFRNANGERAIGEASICYLWSKTAPKNIAREFPTAKILILLRDPAERAFSQYLHMLSFARRSISFHRYITDCLDSKSTEIGELYPFLYFGFYAEQVARYFSLLPRENVRIHFYDDYVRDPRGVLQDYFAFLGVDTGFIPDFRERYMLAKVPRSYGLHRVLKPLSQWSPIKKSKALGLRRALQRMVFRPRNSMHMSPEDRAFLVELYRSDIERLETLLGRDLSSWRLPMAPPTGPRGRWLRR